MNGVNSLVICRENYTSEENFENEVKKAIILLLDAGYVTTVKYDDKGLGIVHIQYNNGDRQVGEPYPYWLTPTEFESVIWEYE
jgi:hypothetical protein